MRVVQDGVPYKSMIELFEERGGTLTLVTIETPAVDLHKLEHGRRSPFKEPFWDVRAMFGYVGTWRSDDLCWLFFFT